MLWSCTCTTLISIALTIAAAVAIARWILTRTNSGAAAKSTAAATAPVQKSRYGSVSSADFAPTAAASEIPSSSLPSAPLDSDLDPSELADYRAARYQTKLDCTTLKAFQLAAQAEHRRTAAATGGSSSRAPALSPSALTLATSEFLRAFPSYDGSSPELPALQRFQHVLQHTHCIFAKKSKCWGSGPTAASTLGAQVSQVVSVVDQTRAALPGFVDFTLRVKDAYPVLKEYASTSEAQAATDAGLSFGDSSASSAASASAAAQAGLSFSDPSTFFTADTKSLLTWSTPLRDFNLDAFVLEVRGVDTSATVMQFADTIRQVLCTLSEADPVVPVRNPGEMDAYGVDVTAAQCMSPLLGRTPSSPAAQTARSKAADEVFSSPRWHFSFLGETFFVTAFANCYPTNHARYMSGAEAKEEVEAAEAAAGGAAGGADAGAEAGAQMDGTSSSSSSSDKDASHPHPLRGFEHSCFVLFQPELSFLRHNLSPDTPHTNWEAPRSERDRIRVAFHKAGRAYVIPNSISYPAAHYIVPPLQAFSGQVLRWWQKGEDSSKDEATTGVSSSATPAVAAAAM